MASFSIAPRLLELARAPRSRLIVDQRTGRSVVRKTTPAARASDDDLVREIVANATHEAGHAVCSLFCANHRPIERITIRSETSWAPAYVQYRDDQSRRLGLTRNQIVDDLCVLYGGIEAERLLLNDVSTGAAGSDLERATRIAQFLVEVSGMGGDDTNVRQYRDLQKGERHAGLSQEQLAVLDRQVNEVIREARLRAANILRENRVLLETLRDLLIEKKTIDAKTLGTIMSKPGSV